MYACCNTLLIGICAIKFCFTTSPFSQNGLFTLKNTDALDNLIWIKFLRKGEIEKRTGGEREQEMEGEREAEICSPPLPLSLTPIRLQHNSSTQYLRCYQDKAMK